MVLPHLTVVQEMDDYTTVKQLYAPFLQVDESELPDESKFCQEVYDRMCATRYEAHFMMVHKKTLGKPALAIKKKNKVLELNSWMSEVKANISSVLRPIRDAAESIIKE